MPAVSEVAKAEFPIPQRHEPLVREFLAKALSDRAIDNRVRFAAIVEHKGQVEDDEFLHLGGKNSRAQRRQIDDATLQAGYGLHIAAERAVRKQFDRYFVAALLADE